MEQTDSEYLSKANSIYVKRLLKRYSPQFILLNFFK